MNFVLLLGVHVKRNGQKISLDHHIFFDVTDKVTVTVSE